MMKYAFAVGVGLIAGFLAGWAVGSYRQAKSTQEAIILLKRIELTNQETRANVAYSSQPPEVAVWELQHLTESLREFSQIAHEPKSSNLKLFLAHARLARLYELEAKQDKAQEHFQEAVRYYNDDHPTANIDDFQAMLERLQKFDEIAKIERIP